MKNYELIEKLQQFPQDMDVCIYDEVANEEEADEEGTGIGVEEMFNVCILYKDEELKVIRENRPYAKNFIALSFYRGL
jgi:hypothetical protein